MSWKIWAFFGACLFVGALILLLAKSLLTQGATTERLKQEQENARTQILIQKGASSFDLCDRAGGVYNFAKSTCKF